MELLHHCSSSTIVAWPTIVARSLRKQTGVLLNLFVWGTTHRKRRDTDMPVHVFAFSIQITQLMTFWPRRLSVDCRVDFLEVKPEQFRHFLSLGFKISIVLAGCTTGRRLFGSSRGFGFSVLGVIALLLLVLSDQRIYLLNDCGSSTAYLVDTIVTVHPDQGGRAGWLNGCL